VRRASYVSPPASSRQISLLAKGSASLMWIFTKPIQELWSADLEWLIDCRIREHISLELKGEMYGGSDKD